MEVTTTGIGANPIKVLLIEDNIGDAMLIQQTLSQGTETSFFLEHVTRLSKGIELLKNTTIDIIILDLALPESQGLETLHELSKHTNVPIIVMSGLENETTAMEAIKNGAKDYLVKGKVDGFRLITSIKFAIERHNNKL